MPDKSAWRRGIFVFLIVASLALLTVSFRETQTGVVHDVRQAFGSLLSPLQALGSRIAEPFQNGYDWFKSVWSAKKRADELELQLNTLQGRLVDLEEQRQENQRLQALLELKEKATYPAGTQFLVAKVIAKAPSQWEAWILINKGSSDDKRLKVGMPVVGATPRVGDTLVGKGLVGKIVEISAHTAKVQLILDSQSAVSAKIQSSRAEGILHGSMEGKVTMDYVDRDLPVTPKLVVVTSGYGGVYPAGIPVGLVSSVGEETINIYKEIEVQPFVDFRVLEEVMVLLVDLPDPLASTTSTTAPAGASSTSVSTPSTTTTIRLTTTTRSTTTTTAVR
jgi:rod shape-determining protein MreC